MNMKKYILSLIVMLCATMSVSAQKVYIAPSKSAIAYHKSKDCSYLRNSKNVTSITTTEAKEMGRHACVRCYPAQAEATKKAIAKEQAEKKVATKKATTTAKKATTTEEKAAEKKVTTKKVAAEKKTAEKPATETAAKKATGTSKVYAAAGGSKYHKKKSCTALAKSKNITTMTLAEAKEKLTPCSVCYTSAKKTATKATEKKATTSKKATTTKKATEKKATEKKTTTKKAA